MNQKKKIWFTKLYLVSTKFPQILLSFASSGTKSHQIPSKTRGFAGVTFPSKSS